ncbi:MAG: GNAT family N-acetyltransferase [Planctomycetota bacterium]
MPSPRTTASVRRINASAARPLRQAVLRQHQPPEAVVYDCDAVETTVHFGAFSDGRDAPVGIVTLLVNPREASWNGRVWRAAWQLRGMATAPDARGLGVGRLLVEACVRHVEECFGGPDPAPSDARESDARNSDAEDSDAGWKARPPADGIWCNARVSAAAFYERCGFRAVSGEFEIKGIGPHLVMVRS